MSPCRDQVLTPEIPRHEGVTEPTEVRNIAQLLGEDFAYVVFESDMGNFDGFVLDPLAYQVFPEFNVLYSLECHVAAQEIICAVAVEDVGGVIYVA